MLLLLLLLMLMLLKVLNAKVLVQGLVVVIKLFVRFVQFLDF